MKETIVFACFLICCGLKGHGQEKRANDKNLYQCDNISPKRVTKIDEGHYFIDFGKDAFGNMAMISKSDQSEPLIVHLGEKLIGPSRIDRKPGGTIRYQKVKMNRLKAGVEIKPKLHPDKRNTGPNAIQIHDSIGTIMPFRYCEIENLKIPIDDIEFIQKVYHYRFKDSASYFTSSDSILNQVWDLCKHTIKATSFAGIYIDGDRERIPYEADAYINQLSHYAVDNEYQMARETIKYFFSNPTWPTEWILHTVLMVYQDFVYTADTEFLKQIYESLRTKTLIDLVRDDGLISSHSEHIDDSYMQKLGFNDSSTRLKDIVDWPPAQKDTGWKLSTEEGERDGHEMMPINTVVNCFFYENMKLMSKLATVLNKNDDADFYDQMASKVKKSINKNLFNPETGRYIDGIGSNHSSLHSNMLPLAFGLVPEDNIPSVVDFVKSRKMACSVYGAQYLLEGLYLAGEADYALDLMISKSDRSWWNMIQSGSTMTMEAWDMKYKPNSDWNHAWGAAPANIISRYMWGITPAEAGFKKVKIAPQLSRLEHSKIKVPTINGAILAEFRKTGPDSWVYSVYLPNDMSGEFKLPIQDDVNIFHNSSEIRLNKGSLMLVPGWNKIAKK